jgi:hypothetical protein
MKSNQLGKFLVSEEFIQRYPDDLAEVFGMLGMVVVKCDFDVARRVLRYTGICSRFAPLKQGEETPMYKFIVNSEYDKTRERSYLSHVEVEEVKDNLDVWNFMELDVAERIKMAMAICEVEK